MRACLKKAFREMCFTVCESADYGNDFLNTL